ncbi:hypothetical protein [Streptomyces sp. NPDC096339]|uniref:hypothetical protein n=1 Tax=Streptomyces sp. NPDC096339 TaxID=3366086 RepID=UPI003808F033
MELLVELVTFVLIGLAVAGVGARARKAVARRARARTASASGGNLVPVPCQARWKQGARRRFFGYGKLTPDTDGTGAVFKAPLRRAVAVPVGGRAAVRQSWRPGMQVLEYSTPDGRNIDFQVYDAEVDRAARFLRIPDPADFA